LNGKYELLIYADGGNILGKKVKVKVKFGPVLN
jgi:hypothetical protein